MALSVASNMPVQPLSQVAQFKLKLLNSVPPLLSPDLLPSPPSLKRKKAEAISPEAAPVTVGLGLGAQNEAVIAKRVRRLSPPPSDVPFTKPSSPALGEAKQLSSSLSSQPNITAPTPDLKGGAFSSALSNSNVVPPSPILHTSKGGPPPPPAQHWKVVFPSERLGKLAALYREKALNMKRRGDKVARDNKAPKAHLLANVILTDALLLYVFAFWCDDQASKKCHTSNWGTLFGLLGFVKSGSEKSGATFVAALCSRIEAHVVHLLSTNEQKLLYSRGTNFAPAFSSPSLLPPSLPSLDSQSQSPPSTRDQVPPPVSTAASDLIKAYTRAGQELFRYQRLFEDSAGSFSAVAIARATPQTWRLCVETNLDVESGTMVVPVKPWRFSWPVELGRTMSIPHLVVFGRGVLEEWAVKEGLEYTPVMVEE